MKLEAGRLVSGSWFFIFLSLLLDTQRGCRRSGVARLVLLSPLNPTPSFSSRRVSPLNCMPMYMGLSVFNACTDCTEAVFVQYTVGFSVTSERSNQVQVGIPTDAQLRV